MKPLAALLLAAALPSAGQYALGPDSQPKPGIPHGTVTRHTLPPGQFYPGTPHEYALYVPAQYNAAKPTALMIFLDGNGALSDGVRAPVVLDNLIHEGSVPPIVGIFINPGVLPAAKAGTQSRFERVFSYDSLSDRFARFLIEEVIPEVGKSYNLSKDPSARAIYGVSTGAVGAFVTAWNRPDQFRRVLSLIGTFVAMKGGDGVAALVRRTEPKPIRVFLQAGRNDHITPGQPYGSFYAGSWPINNQVLFEALRYAGYDARLEMGDGGHNTQHGAAILPDALRWLWRGYPAPVTAGVPERLGMPDWDPRGKVTSFVWPDKGWERVHSGPVTAVAGFDGMLAYAADGKVLRADGSALAAAGAVHALAVGPKGRVIGAVGSRIVEFGRTNRVLRTGTRASALAIAGDAVYAIDAATRSLTQIGNPGASRLEMGDPAGLAVSPDGGMLIVSDSLGRLQWSFQLAASGSPQFGEPFYRLEMPESGWRSEAKGIVVDSLGQVYFATALGIQICEANGRVAALLPLPGVTGLAFHDGNLYAATGEGLFRRPWKVPGGTATALPRPPL